MTDQVGDASSDDYAVREYNEPMQVSVKAKSRFKPYGYLLVESPIFNQPAKLPIVHRDDFILEVLSRGATDEHSNERRYFLAKVERGLEQSEGETISHEEIKAKFLELQHA